jgi:phasin
MAKEPNSYEVPPQVREMAEKTVEQAKKAFEGFMDQAQKAVAAVESHAQSVHTNTKDLNSKAFSFAEQNVAASFDFAQKLTRAKDVNEIVRLQTEFMQAQMRAIGEQAKELGASATKAMADAAKPRG